jgi:hypothetical protein
LLIYGTGSVRRLWTLQENEIFLEHFFAGKGTASFEIIEKLSTKDFAKLTSQLNR